MKRLPVLPAWLSTQFGAMPVGVLAPGRVIDKNNRGTFDTDRRRIDVDHGQLRVAQWQTFFHELVHAALWDAGAHNVLSGKHEEVVVDAVGSFLTQMLVAGQLKLSRAWEKDQSADPQP